MLEWREKIYFWEYFTSVQMPDSQKIYGTFFVKRTYLNKSDTEQERAEFMRVFKDKFGNNKFIINS